MRKNLLLHHTILLLILLIGSGLLFSGTQLLPEQFSALERLFATLVASRGFLLGSAVLTFHLVAMIMVGGVAYLLKKRYSRS
ncbi:MAG TPA: hypothetical protein P5121_28850 [Caldilineaceae bacterium]|nr:hypothetical protein [Caldilineaceae bacterium]